MKNSEAIHASLEEGRRLLETMNPNLEEVLVKKYEKYLPGMAQSLVGFVYGQHYSRPGLALRDRCLATISALTALGGQTSPQLSIHIVGGLQAGLSREEITEAIWQMSLYGGFPASINALNVAISVFDELDAADADKE
ncbi:MAG: carboxymuconolactone decarboxylase family protein [Granulosicoccus sp.]